MITAVFPQTIVQTCIVHLIRNSMDFASWTIGIARAKAKVGLANLAYNMWRIVWLWAKYAPGEHGRRRAHI